jgi:hypothetical protein
MVEFFLAEKFMYIIAKQDSPEVHANAAEVLCAVTRCAPPSLAAKICSPRYSNFILLTNYSFGIFFVKKQFTYFV